MATLKKYIRRFNRVDVDTSAAISTPLMGEAAINATLLQLGKGGGLLASDMFMGVGRVITVDLTVDESPVRAIAKVLYEYRSPSGKVHAGVSFEYMDNSHNDNLSEFLNVKLSKATTPTQ